MALLLTRQYYNIQMVQTLPSSIIQVVSEHDGDDLSPQFIPEEFRARNMSGIIY
jgi:hypothetical protein